MCLFQSLDVIARGLADERVRVGRRYALYERARRLCEAPRSKFADQLARFQHDPVTPTPKVNHSLFIKAVLKDLTCLFCFDRCKFTYLYSTII